MSILRCWSIALVLFGLTLGGSVCAENPPPLPAGIEVLARGPVHEAYAQPVDAHPAPGPVASKQPPEMIEELPPDQKPEGDNVEWIPGYWSWDQDTSNYIWVSGFWRVPPPNHRWLAGHWQATNRGWQWVAGFWAPENIEQVQYLPEPPPIVNAGASIPAPDDNSTYIPGIWVYQQTRYLWRPGFWVPYQPNWVWCRARYQWTPNGYLYSDGYWDHPLDQRGLLFAPVRFGGEWDRGAYTPQYVVNSDFLLGALFVGGASHHYYFGDYFEDRYARRGFVAWPDYRIGANGYDPNYNYYRHEHADEPRWETGMRDYYRGRANGDVARPPQTLVQQVKTINNITSNNTQNTFVRKNINLTNVQNMTALTSLNDVHNTRVTNLAGLSQTKVTKIPTRQVQLQPVTKAEHVRAQQAAAQTQQVAQQRHDVGAKMLRQGMPPVHQTDAPKAVKLDLPKPIPHVVAQPPAKKVDPTPAKKVDPTPAKKVDPTPAKKVDPTPAKKVEPTPAKKVEPTPAKKAEPTPAKKVEPTPAKKAEPTPIHKVAPPAPTPPKHVEQPIPKFTPSPLPGPPKVQPPPPPPPKKK